MTRLGDKHRTTPWAGAAWLVACLALLPGCTSWNQEPEPLRVGLLVWPPYELAHLAHDLGYYDPSRIRLVDYRSPAEVVRAYRYGLIDVMALTTEYFLQLRATEDTHRIIMVVDVSQGGDALLARPGIEGMADLRGHRVGLEASALGAHVLLRCLDTHGLGRSDVTAVPIDVPDHMRGFEHQRVDALVTYEPTRTRLLAEGARELCTSRDLGEDIVDVLITRSDAIDRRGDDLRHLVDGWQRALAFLKRRPEDAAAYMGAREGLTPEQLLEALARVRLGDRQLNAELLHGDHPPLVRTLGRIRGLFLEHGLLKPPLDLQAPIDTRAIGTGS
jgi:NitT/TauT family transport system substrate-binding protein